MKLILHLKNSFNFLECFDDTNGFLEISASGGTSYSYQWSNGSSSNFIENLNSDFYTITVIDSNFCNNSFTYFIDQPDNIQINPTINSVSCFGENDGSIEIETWWISTL